MVQNTERDLFEKMGFKNKRVIVAKICKDADVFAVKQIMKQVWVNLWSGQRKFTLEVMQLKKIRSQIHTNHKFWGSFLFFVLVFRHWEIRPINFLHLDKLWPNPHSSKAERDGTGMHVYFLELPHQMPEIALWFSFKCGVCQSISTIIPCSTSMKIQTSAPSLI